MKHKELNTCVCVEDMSFATITLETHLTQIKTKQTAGISS